MIDVEKMIKDQIDNMDLHYMVTHVIENELRGKIRDVCEQAVRSMSRETIKVIISEEVADIMNSGFTTNDGWGNDKKHPSFEAFFKQELRKSFSNTDLQATVRRHVEEQTKELVKNQAKEITSQVMEEILKKYKDADFAASLKA